MIVRLEALPIPAGLATDYQRRGGRSLRRFAADLPDGNVLRIMVGYEPVMPGNLYGWHVSISIAESRDAGNPPLVDVPTRYVDLAKSLCRDVAAWDQETHDKCVQLYQRSP